MSRDWLITNNQKRECWARIGRSVLKVGRIDFYRVKCVRGLVPQGSRGPRAKGDGIGEPLVISRRQVAFRPHAAELLQREIIRGGPPRETRLVRVCLFSAPRYTVTQQRLVRVVQRLV